MLQVPNYNYLPLIVSKFNSASQGEVQRSQYLSLIHVRLPPGFTPNASVLKPKQVHSAVYENGKIDVIISFSQEYNCIVLLYYGENISKRIGKTGATADPSVISLKLILNRIILSTITRVKIYLLLLYFSE